MQAVELTAWHVRIPLRKKFRHAAQVRTETDNLIVRCVLANGMVGYGEGVPRDYVTGETIDSALALLKRSDLPAQLEPCRDWPAVVAMAERLQLADIPGDVRGCQGNAARCAVEVAVLDAYGRHFGQGLATLTQLVAPELYQPQSWVRYSGIIGSANGFKLRLLSLAMRVYRFKQLKIKVGMPGQDDAARLLNVRRRAGRGMDLRVDANEAWQPDNVVEHIRALEQAGISSVEQPVAHAYVQMLADVRRHVKVPIMLDESLCSKYDALEAVAGKTCDLFNLRLSKCGGFIPSLRLAQIARQHGLGCQLGCQVGETAILSAAGRHFAASVADLRYLEGSYDRHLVREPLSKRDCSFGWGGWAPALPGPGLGVDVDGDALQRVSVRQESLLA